VLRGGLTLEWSGRVDSRKAVLPPKPQFFRYLPRQELFVPPSPIAPTAVSGAGERPRRYSVLSHVARGYFGDGPLNPNPAPIIRGPEPTILGSPGGQEIAQLRSHGCFLRLWQIAEMTRDR